MSDPLVVVVRLELTDGVQFDSEWELIRLLPYNVYNLCRLKLANLDPRYRGILHRRWRSPPSAPHLWANVITSTSSTWATRRYDHLCELLLDLTRYLITCYQISSSVARRRLHVGGPVTSLSRFAVSLMLSRSRPVHVKLEFPQPSPRMI